MNHNTCECLVSFLSLMAIAYLRVSRLCMFPLVHFLFENLHVMSLGRTGETLSVRRLFDVLGLAQNGIGPRA